MIPKIYTFFFITDMGPCDLTGGFGSKSARFSCDKLPAEFMEIHCNVPRDFGYDTSGF